LGILMRQGELGVRNWPVQSYPVERRKGGSALAEQGKLPKSPRKKKNLDWAPRGGLQRGEKVVTL